MTGKGFCDEEKSSQSIYEAIRGVVFQTILIDRNFKNLNFSHILQKNQS